MGIGNVLLRDEGVVARVVEQMQSIHLPREVELVDGGTAGADLLDVICNHRKVIIVDAVDADVPPGTIVRMKPEEINGNASGGISLHELGIVETLQMARLLGCAPKEVVVFGIKAKQNGYGLKLSEKLRKAMPQVIELLLGELNKTRPDFSKKLSEGASRYFK